MENGRRLELYGLNSKAWMDIDQFSSGNKKLDSSIKRNTGFIKKLKLGITKENLPSLVKDLSEVLLSKYLSEIIITSNEALSNLNNKNDDIIAAVEVISILHQRFKSQFSEKLFELFLSNFTNPSTELDNEKDELTRISKINCNLRIFTELYLVGIFSLKVDSISKIIFHLFYPKKMVKKDAILFSLLKEILNHRFRTGYSTIIATSYCKKFPTFFNSDDKSWDSIISDPDLKNSIQMLFKIFVEAAFTRTVDMNKKLRKLLREHKKCQIRTGKVRDEYIDEYDELLPCFERFNSASLAFALIFNLEGPVLESDDAEASKEVTPMITNQSDSTNQIFDNEDTRRFYEALPDLTDTLEQAKGDQREPLKDAVDEFMDRLIIADTKDSIDQLCHDYWLNHIDNKATRKRLLKFFIETQDWSKLNLYARFVAANKDHMPDLSTQLVNYLDTGFSSQLHSDRINFKNIIFFSQFVKFNMVPQFMIFHKIRTLIINLQVPNNIEILTVLFENLGKLLINHPQSKENMEKMMSLVREKSKDRQINMNLKSAVNNLITLVYPPSIKSLNTEKRELSGEEMFYITLIRKELHNVSVKLVTKLIKKASWKDENVVATLLSLFTEPEKVHYQSLPVLSKILAELYSQRKNFVVKIVDQLLYEIDLGLETDNYENNVSRIASIRYLTELYNASIIKSDLLMQTLYSILRYGYPQGLPNPLIKNAVDLKDNYFRIQLVSTSLLNIERITQDLQKSMPKFLRFFEFYTFCKDQPVPVETEFRLSNVFNNSKLDPNFERSRSFEECYSKIMILMQSNQNITEKIPSKTVISENEIGTESEDDILDYSESDESNCDDDDDDELDEESDLSSNELDNRASINDTDDNLSDSSKDDDDSYESSSSDSDSDSDDDDDDDFKDIEADRDIEKKRIYEEYQERLKGDDETKIEQELEKQFQILMQESVDSRKNERVATNNIPIITNGRVFSKQTLLSKSNNDGNVSESKTSNKVQFSFLTKAGKKTQFRTLVLPTDVKFVSNVLKNEEKLKNEREKIKNIVLQRAYE
ncbi:hypothetical protein TPHA_0D02130 [Tetrapisispora phaffii CBS 4417]|uniref:MIF4G domain-containing protein n=1 Tax=Tetrapisispora phaffii (strain ATCC 24235 / CBS 4417 / NBRC 1672 / NRRL Y-8282 / UCD 70-5) TaxID=1071381 RepID=G8BSN0_TETPH|nr:hypothetical protein TPHA_0D02130 [Tetrapisispora phaffii CBS 4417]CCE62851.1 hypothetical protein TPHA_0D02130 [Tetrapisispora phaffii CBS 4417]